MVVSTSDSDDTYRLFIFLQVCMCVYIQVLQKCFFLVFLEALFFLCCLNIGEICSDIKLTREKKISKDFFCTPLTALFETCGYE